MKSYDDIIPTNWETNDSIIKVIGVGGGGCNAVCQMYKEGITSVDFLVCNTDKQVLASSPIPNKLQLGGVITKGLGAGCNPEQGRKAALESIDEIKSKLSGSTEMLFITAGMGGGTGTGAAPIIANIAKELGILTVAVVTLPFRDEGKEFIKRAVQGIKELEKCVDSLLIIDNQKLYKIYGDLSIFEAFPKADSVLSTAVRGIAEIITKPGFVNVDFADVKTVMKNSGMALMGMGEGEGDNRAIKAIEEAINSPLLNDYDLKTAKNVLVNITSGTQDGIKMSELSQIMDYIKEFTGNEGNFKRGLVKDDSLNGQVRVTIVATGFDMNTLPHISQGDEIERIQLNSKEIESDNLEYSSIKKQPVSNDPIKIVITPAKKIVTQHEVSDNRRKRVPTLIIEEGEDITEYENQPAYVRKRVKIENIKEEAQEEDKRYTIENSGGKNIISDNSYIHQNQD